MQKDPCRWDVNFDHLITDDPIHAVFAGGAARPTGPAASIGGELMAAIRVHLRTHIHDLLTHAFAGQYVQNAQGLVVAHPGCGPQRWHCDVSPLFGAGEGPGAGPGPAYFFTVVRACGEGMCECVLCRCVCGCVVVLAGGVGTLIVGWEPQLYSWTCRLLGGGGGGGGGPLRLPSGVGGCYWLPASCLGIVGPCTRSVLEYTRLHAHVCACQPPAQFVPLYNPRHLPIGPTELALGTHLSTNTLGRTTVR